MAQIVQNVQALAHGQRLEVNVRVEVVLGLVQATLLAQEATQEHLIVAVCDFLGYRL